MEAADSDHDGEPARSRRLQHSRRRVVEAVHSDHDGESAWSGAPRRNGSRVAEAENSDHDGDIEKLRGEVEEFSHSFEAPGQ